MEKPLTANTTPTRITAIAAPNGQSYTTKICCSIRLPSMMAEAPPRIAGMTKDPAVSENTRVKPATNPGMLRGSVTRRNTFHQGAPSIRAASSRLGSILPSAEASGSTIIGKNTCNDPMMTATSV